MSHTEELRVDMVRRDKGKGALAFPFLYLSAVSLVLLCCSAQNKLHGHEGVSLSQKLRICLMKRLVKGEDLPDAVGTPAPEPKGGVYVLGGSQKALESRFKTAAYLYHHQIGRRVLLLSTRGITEYDDAIRRNLTNDEWAIKELLGLGVEREAIEPIVLERGLWGTLTEAQGVSALASERGYTQLAVVSSAYHTMRVWLAFSGCLQDRGITLAVYGSDDAVGLSSLVMEYAKLMVYTYIVMPLISPR